MSFAFGAFVSAHQRAIPKISVVAATVQTLRRFSCMVSLNTTSEAKISATATGMETRIRTARRAFSECGLWVTGLATSSKPPCTARKMSFQKYRSTANKVPTCAITLINSSSRVPKPNRFEARRTCPDDDTGSHSVMPWMREMMISWIMDMRASDILPVCYRGSAPGESGNAVLRMCGLRLRHSPW